MYRTKEEINQIFDELDAKHGIKRKDIAQKVKIHPNYLYQILGTGDLNDTAALKLNTYIDENKHLLQDQPPPMNPNRPK